MTSRQLYTNFGQGNYARNFFLLNAKGVESAQLACPFFTSPEPLRILYESGCRNIQLIIRLCGATTPDALTKGKHFGAKIRYFTADAFHAKFYILGRIALLGSANLTDAGLNSNREIAITLNAEDEVFDELPGYFDDL